MLKKPIAQFFIAFVMGIIAPICFGIIFYTSFYHGDADHISVLRFFRTTHILPNLILVSLIPNFIAVFLFNMFEKWNYLRGTFVSIMLYMCIAFFV